MLFVAALSKITGWRNQNYFLPKFIMDDDNSPPPPGDTPPPPPQLMSSGGSPTDFLKGVVGKKVVVRLTSGVDYRGSWSVSSFEKSRANLRDHVGILSCLDGYMNIALEQTEEYVNGNVTNRYGDCFVRGNNGECPQSPLAQSCAYSTIVLYITAAEPL